MITIGPSKHPVPLSQTGELATTLSGYKQFIRTHLGLNPDDVVLISALTCTQPGCPPVETVVVVLDHSHRKWTFPLPPQELTTELLSHHLTAAPEGHLPHDPTR